MASHGSGREVELQRLGGDVRGKEIEEVQEQDRGQSSRAAAGQSHRRLLGDVNTTYAYDRFRFDVDPQDSSGIGELALDPTLFGSSTTLLNADHHELYLRGMPEWNAKYGIPSISPASHFQHEIVGTSALSESASWHRMAPSGIAGLVHERKILEATLSGGINSMGLRVPRSGLNGRPKTMLSSVTRDVNIQSPASQQVLRPEEPEATMDHQILQAAINGDISVVLRTCASYDVFESTDFLTRTTPQGNNCLHIGALNGHAKFCICVITLRHSLLYSVNSYGETPIQIAVLNGYLDVVSALIDECNTGRGMAEARVSLSQALLRPDHDGCNILHHSIRAGHQNFSLQLLAEFPELSKTVSNYKESPMYIAAMRDHQQIVEKLLEDEDSSHSGEGHNNALHAAVRNGNANLVKIIMEKRPRMAKEENDLEISPVRMAVLTGKIEVLQVFLKNDIFLGYEFNRSGLPLMSSAASRGNATIAAELLAYCPDAPCLQTTTGLTSLHEAVICERTNFVKFIIATHQLRSLINIRDNNGKTALHYAVAMCRPNMVAMLLSHPDIDTTMVDKTGAPPAWELRFAFDHAKTIDWNEVCMLLLDADPRDVSSICHMQEQAKIMATNESRKNAKSLTQTYTTNTSVVAILISAITFACAFTVPGGYSSEKGKTEGLPVLSAQPAFKVFLIFDVLAMLSSFLVAFICIIAKWDDYQFLIYYRAFTRYTMWVAYSSTVMTFISGLFTVVWFHDRWLAILICCLGGLVLVFTRMLGEWPVLKLRLRLGRTAFKAQLLDIV